MAQLVEHILGKDEVASSILASSSKKVQVLRLGFFYPSHRLGMASRVCVYGIAFKRMASPKVHPLWLDSMHYRGSDSIRLLCNRFHSVLDGFLSKPQAWYIITEGCIKKCLENPSTFLLFFHSLVEYPFCPIKLILGTVYIDYPLFLCACIIHLFYA